MIIQLHHEGLVLSHKDVQCDDDQIDIELAQHEGMRGEDKYDQ
jgi:hypothetical protein